MSLSSPAAASEPVSPAAVTHEQNERYDRQLRLWGDDGQLRLQSAHVCVLGAGALGTESLKNLVLPGVGDFTLVDEGAVGVDDLGTNFFVDEASVGQPRVEVACRLLNELNPEVKGHFVDADPETLAVNNAEMFRTFTHVIACNLTDAAVLALEQVLAPQRVPLLVATVCGQLGSLRVSAGSWCVVESKPDDPPEDLRLQTAWPQLVEFAQSYDLAALKNGDADAHERYVHVPYPVLLMFYLDVWRNEHNGELPKTRADKDAFKDLVRTAYTGNYDAILEENVGDAVRFAYRAYNAYSMPSEVKAILHASECENVTQSSSAFWVVARAVREFVAAEGHGELPLPGVLGDMTSDSESYVRLQRIFQRKAAEDAGHVMAHVQTLLSKIGRASNSISHRYVANFCKNINFLRHVAYKTLGEEYEQTDASQLQLLLQIDPTHAPLYVVLRAVNRFRATYKRYPGTTADAVERDSALLRQCAQELMEAWGLSSEAAALSDDWFTEVTRYGGAQLHSTAAVIGGVVGQEAIKLITQKYVPINNTFIFNGVSCTTATWTPL